MFYKKKKNYAKVCIVLTAFLISSGRQPQVGSFVKILKAHTAVSGLNLVTFGACLQDK